MIADGLPPKSAEVITDGLAAKSMETTAEEILSGSSCIVALGWSTTAMAPSHITASPRQGAGLNQLCHCRWITVSLPGRG